MVPPGRSTPAYESDELPRQTRDARRRGVFGVTIWLLLPLASLFTGLALLLILRALRASEIEEWQLRVEAAAELRRGAVDDWLGERVADAQLFAGFPSARAAALNSLGSAELQHFQAVLDEYRATHPDCELALVFPDGRSPIAARGRTLDAREIEFALDALARLGPRVDLLQTSADDLRIAFAVPIGGEPTSSRPPSAVLLTARPELALYPRLLRPPFASSSGEAVLGKLENGRVRYLTPRRFASAPKGSYGSTAASPLLAMSQALAGGPIGPDSVDYRGVRVIASGGPLRLVPWALLVKIDEQEALAAYRSMRGALVAASVAVLAALVTAGLLLVTRAGRLEAIAAAAQERTLRLRLDRERRLLQVVYAIGESIARETDGERLCDHCCRILVDEAGYQLAEIVRADAASGELGLVAHHGSTAPISATLGLRFDDSPSGRFAAGAALRQRRAVVSNDLENDPAAEPHRSALVERGYRSGIFLPLVVDQNAWGLLIIFGREPNVFDARSVDLLERTAASVSHALTSIEHRARREEAERERERLVTAVDQADEVVMVTDATPRIEYVNPAFERITGYRRDEVVGRNPSLLKSGAQDGAFYRELWSTLLDGRTWRGRMVNRRKDGTSTEELATISPVRDASGLTTHYVAVKRDLSRETRLERELARAQRLEAVGRLAGGIAHDYNNMLGVVLGYSELLETMLSPEHEGWSALQEIRTATGRAISLTRQLLHFSRQMPSELARIDANESIRKLLRLLHPLLGEDVEVVLRLASEPLEIEVDPSQFDQALVNLAVNARDAMPGGGRLTFETERLGPLEGEPPLTPAETPRPRVRISVSDNGSGMDEATLPHLFEPFFTTKAQGKGTGLGLSIVYAHVQQWGGRISVDSALGRGSTFRMDLPLAIADKALVEPANSEPTVPPRSTILLVEDQEQLRRFLGVALVRLDQTVLTAEDGEAALALIEKDDRPLDLLITDLVMPRMGGLELATLLAKRRPGLRVLFISGYPPEQFSLQRMGASLLQKPFTREALARAVAAAIQGPAFVSEPSATNGTGAP